MKEINLVNMLDILRFVAGEGRVGLTVTEPCLVASPLDTTVGKVASETTRRIYCALGSTIDLAFATTKAKVMCHYCRIDDAGRESSPVDATSVATMHRQEALKALLHEALWQEFPTTKGLPLAINRGWKLTMRCDDFAKAQIRKPMKAKNQSQLVPQILLAIRNENPTTEAYAPKQELGDGEEFVCVLSDKRTRNLFSILEMERSRLMESPLFKGAPPLVLEDQRGLGAWIRSLKQSRRKKVLEAVKISNMKNEIVSSLFWCCVGDMISDYANSPLGIRKGWKIVIPKPEESECPGCHGCGGCHEIDAMLSMALPGIILGGMPVFGSTGPNTGPCGHN